MTAARNHVGNRFGDNLLDEPLPALRDYSKIVPDHTVTAQDAEARSKRPTNSHAPSFGESRISKQINVEEDLINFDDILNSDWATTSNIILAQPVEAFPGLPSFKNPMGGLNIMDDLPTGLSTNPRPISRTDTVSQTSTTSVIEKDVAASTKTTMAGPRTFSQFDPSNPQFKVNDHYVQFTGKYKCPHRGCMKTFAQQSAFIQHLRSPAHNDVQFQCHGCLRYFVNATALAQHASDQGGVRCRVRDTDNYEREVNRWTAGHVTTDGRWDDDTIRYVATGQQQSASAMADNHNAKLAEKNKAKEEFWLNNTPAW